MIFSATSGTTDSDVSEAPLKREMRAGRKQHQKSRMPVDGFTCALL
jgi:hypothetical protein